MTITLKGEIKMIRNLEQIKTRWSWDEYEKRSQASENSVARLTLPQIEELLSIPFSKEELRLERKRRVERLRYLRIISNPRSRAEYRARKQRERQERKIYW
jgi:hypothetical protein